MELENLIGSTISLVTYGECLVKSDKNGRK